MKVPNNKKTFHSEEKEKMLRRIAKDTVASFKLEGIILSMEEAYQMALEADYKTRGDNFQV
jgi:hypothetical protein